jgi:hypothetical protein
VIGALLTMFVQHYYVLNGISIDPKSGDARASFGYLLQQLTEDYDQREKKDKRKVKTASHSGFCGGLYILDQYYQIDLQSMEWVKNEDLG